MGYQICYEKYGDAFMVPGCIVKEHLPFCSVVHLKVILCVLQWQQNPVEPERLAQTLNLPLEDIKDALNFWVNLGLLKNTPDPSGEKNSTAPADKNAPYINKQEQTEKKDGYIEAEPEQKDTAPPKPTHARITASEIHEITCRQPVLRSLLHEAEGMLGKTLTSTDMSTLISLHDWAGMDPEVILLVVAYCVSSGKRNLRYIEKTALSWLEMGLDNDEAIEKYLATQSEVEKLYKQVKEDFGIYNRQLSTKEKEYIDKWFNEYHFSHQMVCLAFEITVDNTGKLAFAYLNKILASWHDKGYQTPQDTLKETSEQKKNAGKKEYSFNLDDYEKFVKEHTPQ